MPRTSRERKKPELYVAEPASTADGTLAAAVVLPTLGICCCHCERVCKHQQKVKSLFLQYGAGERVKGVEGQTARAEGSLKEKMRWMLAKTQATLSLQTHQPRLCLAMRKTTLAIA